MSFFDKVRNSKCPIVTETAASLWKLPKIQKSRGRGTPVVHQQLHARKHRGGGRHGRPRGAVAVATAGRTLFQDAMASGGGRRRPAGFPGVRGRYPWVSPPQAPL